MTDYRTAYVYAGGTMSGLTLDGSRNGWRAEFADALAARNDADHIHVLSPCRSEPEEFAGVLDTAGAGMPVSVLTRDSRSVMAKDRLDIDRCDLFVAGYLDGGGLMSLGTAWEHGYAHAIGKPIMTLGDPSDVNISHLLLNGSADFHADTVAEAVRAAVLLLTPGL